jgi:hypothetical protein
MKLMGFVRDCDSGAGPSNCNSMKKSSWGGGCWTSSLGQPEVSRRNISLWSHVCTESQVFHEALGFEGEFSASVGWLTRFKQWYGIREIVVQGERLSAIDAAVGCYEGESNGNRKTEIKIRNIAPLSYKLADMLPML